MHSQNGNHRKTQYFASPHRGGAVRVPRRTKMIALAIVTSLFMACSNQQQAEQQTNTSSTTSPYFSLETYFSDQIRTLEQNSPEIVKTVDANGQQESRTLTNMNWKNELAPFVESDINKPAWVNSYTVDRVANTIRYQRKEDGLRTEKIIITTDDRGDVQSIYIENNVSNVLYNSTEHLRYYPDSLYEITREQSIRMIGKNRYHIRGRIVQSSVSEN